MSCDHGHRPLHHPRKRRKEILNQEKQIKRKEKGSSIVATTYYNDK